MSNRDPRRPSSAKAPGQRSTNVEEVDSRKFEDALRGLEEFFSALPEPTNLQRAAVVSTFSRSAFAFIVLIKPQLMEWGELRQGMKPDDAYKHANMLLEATWGKAKKRSTCIKCLNTASFVLAHGNFTERARVLLGLLEASRVELDIKKRHDGYYPAWVNLKRLIMSIQKQNGQREQVTIKYVGTVANDCMELTKYLNRMGLLEDRLGKNEKTRLDEVVGSENLVFADSYNFRQKVMRRNGIEIRDFTEPNTSRGSREGTVPEQIAGTPTECSTDGHQGANGSNDEFKERVKNMLEVIKKDYEDLLKSPFIKFPVKRSMARMAIAFVTVLQAEVMEQIGFKKIYDRLIKLTQSNQSQQWDPAFAMKLDQAREYAQQLTKGEPKEEDTDKDLETCFSYASGILSKGSPDDWIEVLEHLFIACEAGSKIVELHRDYESRRYTIEEAKKASEDSARVDSCMKKLKVLLQNIDSAKETLRQINAEVKILKGSVGKINAIYIRLSPQTEITCSKLAHR